VKALHFLNSRSKSGQAVGRNRSALPLACKNLGNKKLQFTDFSEIKQKIRYMNYKNHLLPQNGLIKPEEQEQKCILKYPSFALHVIVVVFLLVSLTSNGQPKPDKNLPHHDDTETEKCDNFIKIEGSTNVNHFFFEQIFTKKEEIIEKKGSSGEMLKIKIPVHDFTPSNPMMYKDFLELIKASEYPYIDITIFSENIKLPAGPPNTVLPRIKIGLAGESHTYRIPGEIYDCKTKSMHLNGKISISLKDFNLEPPTKFMGMVKVNNEVFINFGLTLNK
jgi:hypothetical protein